MNSGEGKMTFLSHLSLPYNKIKYNLPYLILVLKRTLYHTAKIMILHSMVLNIEQHC